MLANVDNGGGRYGDVLLMRANEAAGHVPVEASDTVAQNVMFMACLSSVLQVPNPYLRLVLCDFVQWQAHPSAAMRKWPARTRQMPEQWGKKDSWIRLLHHAAVGRHGN
jgi:hypothetical protein